jgi:7,8-dihydroneopterin aldolase/epimerase/oxygenase
VNASWTIRVERLEVRLPVGIHADELGPQPLWVSLAATGTAPASPQVLDHCFDYEPLCRWLTQDWPRTPHTPLLETRINQLFAFLFGLDERLQTLWVGLYKQRMSSHAVAVGIERQVTRLEYQAMQDMATAAAAARTTGGPVPGKGAHATVHC